MGRSPMTSLVFLDTSGAVLASGIVCPGKLSPCSRVSAPVLSSCIFVALNKASNMSCFHMQSFNGPVSHAAWCEHVRAIAVSARAVVSHVQCQVKGETFCASVVDSSSGHDDWFLLDVPALGRVVWVAGARVRLCEGLDGRCTCSDGGSL